MWEFPICEYIGPNGECFYALEAALSANSLTYEGRRAIIEASSYFEPYVSIDHSYHLHHTSLLYMDTDDTYATGARLAWFDRDFETYPNEVTYDNIMFIKTLNVSTITEYTPTYTFDLWWAGSFADVNSGYNSTKAVANGYNKVLLDSSSHLIDGCCDPNIYRYTTEFCPIDLNTKSENVFLRLDYGRPAHRLKGLCASNAQYLYPSYRSGFIESSTTDVKACFRILIEYNK
jgi:hypothetical protein